ncbi:hypothetical protein [Fusobacterium sp. PH5-44]|uniref:hypothetical protein n=1 Tax=unclassified Fusobacterium TaxID=2648384 RepID=UPI003D1D4DF4
MFKIKYKIYEYTDSENVNDEILGLFGYFQLVINEFTYGTFYKEKNEFAFEIIYVRFIDMLMGLKYLKEKPYIIINDIKNIGHGLEIKKDGNNIFVGPIYGRLTVPEDYLKSVGFNERNDQYYTKFYPEKISLKEFKEEILKKSKSYLAELEILNGKNSELITFLRKKINDCENN